MIDRAFFFFFNFQNSNQQPQSGIKYLPVFLWRQVYVKQAKRHTATRSHENQNTACNFLKLCESTLLQFDCEGRIAVGRVKTHPIESENLSRCSCRVILSLKLVSRCSVPSHPQRITSGLNTNFTLSPS